MKKAQNNRKVWSLQAETGKTINRKVLTIVLCFLVKIPNVEFHQIHDKQKNLGKKRYET